MALSSKKVTSVRRGVSLGFGAVALCFVATASVHSQSNLSNAGTLTCTVTDVPEKASSTLDVSCNFKSLTGATTDYAGSASTKAGVFPAAKYVFVWSVVVVQTGKVPVLEGTFSADPSGQGSAVLKGGHNIRLEPAEGSQQVAGLSEITTLTLMTVATKT